MANDEFPLRVGSDAAFAAVRKWFEWTGFTEDAVKEHFEIPHLHHLLYAYGLQREFLEKKYQAKGITVFQARTFIGGYADTAEIFATYMGMDNLSAFFELGLLVEEEFGRYSCPVLLYPALGFWVAADRGLRPDGTGYRGKDYVMSGTEFLCRQYVDTVSTAPCKAFLDMGSGSGLAALVGTRFAARSLGIDITHRAVQFADFNKHLNACQNLTFLEGDMFAPVHGMHFDRIASNPPFEPPLKEGMIFSVGGADGEAILARLIAEAPQYLEPGGRLYCQVSGTDRAGDPFDARLRRWLGAAAEDCDTAVFIRVGLKPNEYAIQQILGENQDSWKLQEWLLFYQKLQAEQVILGHCIVQKRASADRQTFHLRRTFGERTGLKEMDWLVDWETRVASPGFAEWAMSSRPMACEGWEVIVCHEMANGKLEARSFEFVQTYPFDVRLQAASWMVMVASRSDGSFRASEHFDFLKGKVDVTEAEFLAGLVEMVRAGVLVLEGRQR